METPNSPNQLLRQPQASAITGIKKSTFYDQVGDGLMVQPVSLGGKNRVWPLRELEQLNAARIRGASDDEIRALVVELESARTGTPATPRRKPERQRSAPLATASA